MRKIYWDLDNGVKKLNSDYEDIYFLLHVLYNAKTELYDRTLTDMRSRYDPTEAFINAYNKNGQIGTQLTFIRNVTNV